MKKYPCCIWDDEDNSPCYKCSLNNYGLDCMNNPIMENPDEQTDAEEPDAQRGPIS